MCFPFFFTACIMRSASVTDTYDFFFPIVSYLELILFPSLSNNDVLSFQWHCFSFPSVIHMFIISFAFSFAHFFFIHPLSLSSLWHPETHPLESVLVALYCASFCTYLQAFQQRHWTRSHCSQSVSFTDSSLLPVVPSVTHTIHLCPLVSKRRTF